VFGVVTRWLCTLHQSIAWNFTHHSRQNRKLIFFDSSCSFIFAGESAMALFRW